MLLSFNIIFTLYNTIKATELLTDLYMYTIYIQYIYSKIKMYPIIILLTIKIRDNWYLSLMSRYSPFINGQTICK